MEFTIKQKLPSLNDYVRACRSYWSKGAKLKSEVETAIGWYIRLAEHNGTLHKTRRKVWIKFTWIEKSRRRDKDNVASAKKFILDALVKNGILVDDGNDYVAGFSDTFIYGAEYAVIVEINELKE